MGPSPTITRQASGPIAAPPPARHQFEQALFTEHAAHRTDGEGAVGNAETARSRRRTSGSGGVKRALPRTGGSPAGAASPRGLRRWKRATAADTAITPSLNIQCGWTRRLCAVATTGARLNHLNRAQKMGAAHVRWTTRWRAPGERGDPAQLVRRPAVQVGREHIHGTAAAFPARSRPRPADQRHPVAADGQFPASSMAVPDRAVHAATRTTSRMFIVSPPAQGQRRCPTSRPFESRRRTRSSALARLVGIHDDASLARSSLGRCPTSSGDGRHGLLGILVGCMRRDVARVDDNPYDPWLSCASLNSRLAAGDDAAGRPGPIWRIAKDGILRMRRPGAVSASAWNTDDVASPGKLANSHHFSHAGRSTNR